MMIENKIIRDVTENGEVRNSKSLTLQKRKKEIWQNYQNPIFKTLASNQRLIVIWGVFILFKKSQFLRRAYLLVS